MLKVATPGNRVQKGGFTRTLEDSNGQSLHRPPVAATMPERRCGAPHTTQHNPAGGFPWRMELSASRRRSTSRSDPMRPVRPKRSSLKAKIAEMLGEEIEIPLIIGGKEVRTGKHGHGGVPARPRPRARRLPQGRRGRGRADGRRGRGEAWQEWSRDALGATARRSSSRPPTCWPARGATRSTPPAMLGQSKTVYPGRDRRGLRADRLLALQPLLHARHLRAAAGVRARALEPRRVPRPRGLRLRGHAVQLHLDRRQPADRAGADGQHRAVEAGLVGGLHRLAPHEAAAGGRAAARRDQLRPGLGRPGRRPGAGRARTSPASTSPARPRSSRACGRRSATTSRATSTYPRIVGETGGKDFIFAHASADAGGAGHRPGARRLRVPGPEVLGRLARLHPEVALARGQGTGRSARPPRSRWATPTDFTQLHGRGHRQGAPSQTSRATSTYAKDSTEAEILCRRRLRRLGGLLHRADRGADHQPAASSSWRRRSSGRC